jgi:hypothetical protein
MSLSRGNRITISHIFLAALMLQAISSDIDFSTMDLVLGEESDNIRKWI